MRYKTYLNNLFESEVVYHGTTKDVYEYLKDKGFDTLKRFAGMSSTNSKLFTFVSPKKSVAEYYAKDNFRNKNPMVLKLELNGKIFDTNLKAPDYEVFGYLMDHFKLREKGEHFYDENKIANALINNGYVGFSFKDRNAFNKLAYGVIPKFLKMDDNNEI